MPRSAAIAERLVGDCLVDLQIRLGVACRDPGAGEIRRNDVVGLLTPIMQADSEIGGDHVRSVGAVAGQQVVGLGGICAQVVEFAFRARAR